MHHLNYCRQMVKQFTSTLSSPNYPAANRAILSHCIDLARASTKFILPDGGRMHEDGEFKALDESIELRLPYPFIALEYFRPQPPVFTGDSWGSTRAIVFARERDDVIVVTAVPWWDSNGIWGPMPEVAIPRIGYLNRSAPREAGPAYAGHIVHTVPVAFFRTDERIPASDYGQELGSLLCFLNILQCSNVRVEQSKCGGVRKAMGKRGALPFDDYHVLTIESHIRDAGAGGLLRDARSPREHLRRGHIRRLQDGRKLWVNATIVNPGVGGKVQKDYRVCA